VDLSKPPTRLKVVLLSLPPRTQAVLDYFFSSTGRSSFSPTSADVADAAIFDLDTLESRNHWDAFYGQTGRPGIAMSIQPQQVTGAVWVRKPITPAALLHAAAASYVPTIHPEPVRKGAKNKARAPYLAGLEHVQRQLEQELGNVTDKEAGQLRTLLLERLDTALSVVYEWFPAPGEPKGAAKRIATSTSDAQPSDWREWDWD